MNLKRARYLAPNLITLASFSFGLLSIHASVNGHWATAAWFIVFSVLTDKLDGFVARLLKAASEFGVQADSLADFLNFGVAPAVLFYTYLSNHPELPYRSGGQQTFLLVVSGLWVLSVAFRLARYNVVGDDPRCHRIFFGVPTTLMGGVLATVFLTAVKYGTPVTRELAEASFDEPRLLGGFETPRGLWIAWPYMMLGGAFLMASAFKIPKLGLSKSKALTAFIFANVVAGYILGFLRMLPEYLTWGPAAWIVTSLVWGTVNKSARGLKPPSIFPPDDRPNDRMPQRPEDDNLAEGDDGNEDDEPVPAPR